ncbi:MAG: FG-GAP-like repeat-containing protein [Acidobacteria bacterium]|nr:FG-GAP-like repeat-containing protein [Acidobacteriota bacterium]
MHPVARRLAILVLAILLPAIPALGQTPLGPGVTVPARDLGAAAQPFEAAPAGGGTGLVVDSPGALQRGGTAREQVEELPPGVGEDWWSVARHEIAASEYFATWQAETPFADLGAAWQAPNRAHDFRTWFTENGVRLVPRRKETPPWEWSLSLVGWGRPAAMRPVGPARLSVLENRVEADRGELVEWFVNDPRGLEQGFTIDAPPPGDGPLALDLAVGGTLSAILAEDHQAVDFTAPDGRRVLHYGQLLATDAGGAVLASRFESFCDAGRCGVRIVVDDAGAAYPLTIDPLATSPAWIAEGGQEGANLGYSIAPAGDVNGDGYDDVIVGLPFFDYVVADRGRALLYFGNPSGLSTTFGWQAQGSQEGDLFGYSVATAGDFNDDGYADLLVGVPYRDPGGMAYVYCGHPYAPSPTPCWSTPPGQLGSYRGWRVATAGDVSGDGISDILVGAPGHDWPDATNGGAVWVYYGSAGVPDTVYDWYIRGTVAHPAPPNGGYFFGRAIGTAGDVNGDGYAEIVVTDPYVGAVYVDYGSANGPSAALWSVGYPDVDFGWSALAAGDLDGDGYGDLAVGAPLSGTGGSVRIYRGRAAGLDPGVYWDIDWTPAEDHFGYHVGTAGDVNGDGYSDLIVSANRAAYGFGMVLVYHGSPAGPGTAWDWSCQGTQAEGEFGSVSATAGDVNGDGFSDIVIGAPWETYGQEHEGRAYLFLGGAAWLTASSAWSAEGNNTGGQYGYSVASAGDVNGDGFSDVIVGAVLFDDGETNEGKAFVYHGSATGPSATANWTAVSNQPEARMGYSVSSAGDVNGDGYSDVIIGARGYSDTESDEGHAFVWLGSASGLGGNGSPPNSDWHAEANQASAYFGIAVASAGDVNGDGFGDVIVGASLFDDGQTDEGAAFVWHGSATGLGPNGQPINADWKAFGNQASSRFGAAVGTAGDVNDDGYGEVLIGAYAYDAPDSNEGAAFAWYGSSSGLGSTGSPTNADWSAEVNQAGAYFGYSLAWAGDVNGDGFSDVAVGSYLYDGAQGADQGRVAVYHGSNIGLPAAATEVLLGLDAGDRFGFAVNCAGDLDGDGYADLIVGAPAFGDPDRGAAMLYRGGAAGLVRSLTFPSGNDGDSFGQTVAGAGDVNGDGYADVIVGAPLADNPEASEGQARLYLGNQGLSRTFKPGQVNGSGDGLILPRFGRSNDDWYVRLIGRAFGMLGRARFKVQSEVKGSRHPFDGYGIETRPDEFETYTTGGDFTARPRVGSGLQHWRVRPLFRASDSPFQSRGHVYRMPWAGQNEGDFRTSHDSDGDGLNDEFDNCPEAYNPSQADADGDGRGDDCDTCTDTDHDGYGDPGYPINTCNSDNCPALANPGQEDDDNDGIGNLCDSCTDTDRDGFGNLGYDANTCPDDNCPTLSNPDQADGEGDGVGDRCDNCVANSNPGQEDFDQDGVGDLCDLCTDTDGDGRENPGFPRSICGPDNCPDVPNADQQDTDRDGSGDVCDDCTDGDHDGYGDPDPQQQTCPPDNCVRNANPGQEDADTDGSGDACDKCTDTDGDGWGTPGFPVNTCAEDCRPDDNTIWSAPSPIDSLVLTREPTGNLSWSPPPNPGATTIQYDAITSREMDDWSIFEAICILSDTTELSASDPSVPPPGQAYYYLIRAEGPCGSNMGTRSDGTPRVGRACP